jgi:hypothetical protein
MKKSYTLPFLIIFEVLSFTVLSQTSECLRHFSSYDTVFHNGDYLKYNLVADNATIEFGNSSFHRSLPEKYNCDIADSRIPHCKWHNNEFIGLGYGCGTPCWGIMVLPLNPKDTVRNIMYDLAFDSATSKIVYIDNLKYEKIVVENLKTGYFQEIELKTNCDASFIGYCIDSVSISNNELYYRLAEPDKIARDKKTKEFQVLLK